MADGDVKHKEGHLDRGILVLVDLTTIAIFNQGILEVLVDLTAPAMVNQKILKVLVDLTTVIVNQGFLEVLVDQTAIAVVHQGVLDPLAGFQVVLVTVQSLNPRLVRPQHPKQLQLGKAEGDGKEIPMRRTESLRHMKGLNTLMTTMNILRMGR